MDTNQYPLYAPGDILNVAGIQHREIVLFMVLFGMMRLEGYCWATNEYLCSRLSWSERTLQRSMKILHDLCLIRIETDGCNRKIYPVKYDALKQVNLVSSDDLTPSNMSQDGGPSIFLINKHNKITKNEISKIKFEEQLRELYKNYPLKKGKTVGLKKLSKQIKTEEQLTLLAKAITNYAAECKGKEPQYIKHFSTFASCWEDYIDTAEARRSTWAEVKLIDGKLVSVDEE